MGIIAKIAHKKPRVSRENFDAPWKEARTVLFKECMDLLFPAVFAKINWSRKVEFLDKELRAIARSAKIGLRHADKLVKVYMRDGTERWLLIHIEVQSQVDKSFPLRMLIYHVRAFELYGREVVSLAILADENSKWRPDRYLHSNLGYELRLIFPIVKLNDYRARIDELMKSTKPFAHVALAFLKTQDTRGNDLQRKSWKFELTKNLYRKGFNRQRIDSLYSFIDWVMHLPDNLTRKFDADMMQFEEELKMPYVTSTERNGIQKGRVEEAREKVIHVLSKRFGRVPDSIKDALNKLGNLKKLNRLFDQALDADSLKNFPLK